MSVVSDPVPVPVRDGGRAAALDDGLVWAPIEPETVSVPPPSPSRHAGYGRGFWGVAVLISTEGMLFVALVATYFFLRASSRAWPLGGIESPAIGVRAWVFTALLLGSSLPIFWADSRLQRGRVEGVRLALALSALMGAAFLLDTVLEFRDLTFGWDTNAYGSIYYVIVGLHATHVAVGLAIGLVVQLKLWMGLIDAEHHTSVEVFSLYWHFVDAVWILVFSAVFISPHVR